ncbi:MAG TPA: outer membrane protein transport protein [Kiritimatiellia bacterium]|nr:outer membrane protein transport protein [Kiritimatiellia bacterium]
MKDVTCVCAKRVVSVVVILLAAAVAAPGSGFRNPPEDAQALGRPGGKIAIVENATAVEHNPANLMYLEGVEAEVGATFVYAKSDFNSVLGFSETTENNLKVLPALYFGLPLGEEGRFAAGFGLSVPFGQSTEWSESGSMRYLAPYLAELSVVNLNPSFAAKLGDKILIGIGADLYSSTFNMQQVYPWSAVVGAPVRDGEAEIESTGEGLGGNIGVTWEITKSQRLAATYRSAVTVDYDGDFRVDNIPADQIPAALSFIRSSSSFGTEITFPAIAALGYAFKVGESLWLEADVEWIEFSQYDTLKFDAGRDTALLPQTEYVQDWDDSWTFGFGADWGVTKAVTLRAGYMFIESPIPDETLAPTLPDADRHVLSVGAGYTHGKHTFDVGYAYSIFDERDIDVNVNPAYVGSYDLSSQLFNLSYTYTF